MTGLLLTACFVLALLLLGCVAAVAPGALMRYHFVPLAFGLTAGVRRAITRAVGASLLLLSLWLAWRFFVAGV